MLWIIFTPLWFAVICAIKLPSVHWNSSNPIFRIDNTDHIIDVNQGNIPYEYDQVNIICPVIQPGTNPEDVEQYIIYNVSKEEYNSCRITNPNPRIIALCDKPEQLMYFTITFRSFTPQPGGLEFRPGQDYYFISTSDGKTSGLKQKSGGKCATHNMRIIFKVCCDENSNGAAVPSSTTSTARPTTPLPPRTRPPLRPTFLPPTATPYIPRRPTPPRWLQRYPNRPNKTFDLMPREDDRGKHSKKSDGSDRLPNETRAKNEELVNKLNRGSSTLSRQMLSSLIPLLLLTLVVAR